MTRASRASSRRSATKATSSPRRSRGWIETAPAALAVRPYRAGAGRLPAVVAVGQPAGQFLRSRQFHVPPQLRTDGAADRARRQACSTACRRRSEPPSRRSWAAATSGSSSPSGRSRSRAASSNSTNTRRALPAAIRDEMNPPLLDHGRDHPRRAGEDAGGGGAAQRQCVRAVACAALLLPAAGNLLGGHPDRAGGRLDRRVLRPDAAGAARPARGADTEAADVDGDHLRPGAGDRAHDDQPAAAARSRRDQHRRQPDRLEPELGGHSRDRPDRAAPGHRQLQRDPGADPPLHDRALEPAGGHLARPAHARSPGCGCARRCCPSPSAASSSTT